MRDKGLKCALVKSGSSLPKTDMGFELGPSTEGSDEYVNAGNFRDVVTGGPEEFVVVDGVATEIAELVEFSRLWLLVETCLASGVGRCDFA